MDFVTLTPRDASYLHSVLDSAIVNGQDVHLTIHPSLSHGGIQVKRGGGIWTSPFGLFHKGG